MLLFFSQVKSSQVNNLCFNKEQNETKARPGATEDIEFGCLTCILKS